MLSEQEFYYRFNQLDPGEKLLENSTNKVDWNIYFERLSMSGLMEMHKYSMDERLYEFFEFSPFDSIDKTKAYITKLEQRMAGDASSRTSAYWFVRRRSDDLLIGTAGLVNLNYSRKSIEWGYGIDPELWGSGFILQIQEDLKRYVFEALELNRLYGTTMVGNQRTISSVLAAGMQHEGNLRDYYCKNGVFHDAWQYAMLRRDYLLASTKNATTPQKYNIDDVIELVSSVLTEECVTSNTAMIDSPTWDSFNHMLIMIAITEKMGVTLSPKDVARATSVKAIMTLING